MMKRSILCHRRVMCFTKNRLCGSGRTIQIIKCWLGKYEDWSLDPKQPHKCHKCQVGVAAHLKFLCLERKKMGIHAAR